MSKPFSPRPWQIPMLEHLTTHNRCALWAKMGLGKTAVVLTWIMGRRMAGDERKCLILAPLRVARKTWQEECLKWDHLVDMDIIPVIGQVAESRKALAIPAENYSMNYENLPWLIKEFGEQWPFKIVIADESDALKSHRISERIATRKDGTRGTVYYTGQGSQRAGALARIAHTRIESIIQLTGTPAPNGLTDLWGQVWFLDRGERLGRTFEAFSKRWFDKGYDGYSITAKSCADSQINTAVKDLCLAVDGKDWFNLDEPVKLTVEVELPGSARATYRDMEKEMFAAIAGREVQAVNAAAKTAKCLQIASGAVYVEPEATDDIDPRSRAWREVHDEKIQALKSIVAETGGSPLMVCYEFRSDAERLTKAFPKGRVLSTVQDEADFKAGKIPLLFLHPKSCGHGIDGFQHACHHIVFFGHNWNLGQYLQVIERVGPVRQMQAGLNRPVYVYHIVAKGTIDELVMERRETKREVQDILMNACKGERRGND